MSRIIKYATISTVCVAISTTLVNQTKNTRWKDLIVRSALNMISVRTELVVRLIFWIAEGIFLIRRSKGGS